MSFSGVQYWFDALDKLIGESIVVQYVESYAVLNTDFFEQGGCEKIAHKTENSKTTNQSIKTTVL